MNQISLTLVINTYDEINPQNTEELMIRLQDDLENEILCNSDYPVEIDNFTITEA